MVTQKNDNPDELILVKKRENGKNAGKLEPLDIEKIHKVVYWAAEHTSNPLAWVSKIVSKAKLQFHNGMTTEQIHEAVVRAASELVSVEDPDAAYVAARLELFDLRKKVWDGKEAPKLKNLVQRNVQTGFYDKDLLSYFSDDEWDLLESYIDHDRDYLMAYAGVRQIEEKYIVQDRVTKKMIETPQFLYLLAAMIQGVVDYRQHQMSKTKFKQNKTRNHMFAYIKELYDDYSQQISSLPSPVMNGLRTSLRQFSSCVLVKAGDDLPSLGATNQIMMTYGAARAGLGADFTSIRALNSPIRGGAVKHTGLVPFLHAAEKSLNSCSQGGMRKASATVNVLAWHLDFEDLIVLKNNKGTDENRVRQLDYVFHLNKYLLSRVLPKSKIKHITLFSPHEVPELYDAFYSGDTELFGKIYEECEANPKLKKKTISATDWIDKIAIERQETGRDYLFFADNVNSHSSFLVPITQTNLCVEITLPTVPLTSFGDDGRKTFILKVKPENLLDVVNMPEKELSKYIMGKMGMNPNKIEKVSKDIEVFEKIEVNYKEGV